MTNTNIATLPRKGGRLLPRPERAALIEAIESGDYTVTELTATFGYTPGSISRIRIGFTDVDPFAPGHTLNQYNRMVEMIVGLSHSAQEIADETTYTVAHIQQCARMMDMPLFTHRHPVDGMPYVARPPFFSDAPIPEPRPYADVVAEWRAGTLTDPILFDNADLLAAD